MVSNQPRKMADERGCVERLSIDGYGNFNYGLIIECGVVITVRQTIQLVVAGTGVSVDVTGKAQLELECGKGASGRACEAFARVEATTGSETGTAV
jgi:hypothetical protein